MHAWPKVVALNWFTNRINPLTSHRSLPIVLSHIQRYCPSRSALKCAYWRQLAIAIAIATARSHASHSELMREAACGTGQLLLHLTQHMPHPQNCIDWESAPHMLPDKSVFGYGQRQLCRLHVRIRIRIRIMRHSPFATLAK